MILEVVNFFRDSNFVLLNRHDQGIIQYKCTTFQTKRNLNSNITENNLWNWFM